MLSFTVKKLTDLTKYIGGKDRNIIIQPQCTTTVVSSSSIPSSSRELETRNSSQTILIVSLLLYNITLRR